MRYNCDNTTVMEEKQLIKCTDESIGLDVEFSLVLSEQSELDKLIENSKQSLFKYDCEIDKRKFKGDNIDLMVAASSGFFCGLMDAVFLTNIDLTKCQALGKSAIEPIIKFMGGSNNLNKAVANLEKRTKKTFPSDPNLADFGGGLQHHLRDMAHHFSPLGLFFSLLTQFTGFCYGFDTTGNFIIKEVIDKSRIGTTLGQKLSFGTVEWFFHLGSDMLGTSKTIGRGTGIPGPMLSFAKELSSVLPKNKNGENSVSSLISKMFNGTLFADHDDLGKIIPGTEKPLDFTAELGMTILQSIPVMLNMVFVRMFYFIRRLINEFNSKKDNPNYKINWKATIPFFNPTIRRMTTVANCAFSATDLSLAVITSAAQSGGTIPGFIAKLVLSVNYAGLQRMAISLVEESVAGIKMHSLEKKRIKEIVILTKLYESKIYLNENNLWLEIEETEESIKHLECIANEAATSLIQYFGNIQDNLDKIENDISDNNALKKYLLSKLED